MSSKELLKKAKDHLANKEFAKAKDVCSRVLMFDGSNYTGLIYLGLAQQNLGLSKESEATYKRAIFLNPSQPLAYQVDMLPQAYGDARQVFMECGTAAKVVELTNKLIEFYAQDPAYLDLRLNSMRSLLPGGEMHPYVEKSGAEQKSLLTTMAELEYARDQKLFISEVESRRRRLSNDTMATIKRKVKTEIHQQSLYLSTIEMILASKDDLDEDGYLKFNESYLAYLLERLLHTNMENKLEVLRKLLHHASKLVSEGVPLDLAYEVHYGFQDVADSEYKMEMYLETYPSTKLALLAQHILGRKNQPFVIEDTWSICMIGHHALAWHFMRLNQTDLALSHAKSLDALTKDFSEAMPQIKKSCRLVFAFCYLKSEPSLQNVAYNTLQSILETDPNNLMALEGVSIYAISKGRLDLARSSTSAALAIDPCHPAMLLSLGWIHILSGEPAEAVTCIQKSLALSPNSALGLFRLGRGYWDMGKSFREDKNYAYNYFLKAAQLDPMFGDPFLFLGHFYRDVAGDLTRALKCYLKATQLKQGIEAYKALYAQQLLANDILGAQNSAHQATQEFPTLAWPWDKMGHFHLTNSRWSEAITCFQGALKADFNCVEYWEGLGEAYLEAGRLMAALKAFQRAEKLAPHSFKTAYHSAKVHLLLGNHPLASNGLASLSQTLAKDDLYFLPCTKLLAEVYYCHCQVSHRSGAFGLMAMLAQKSLDALERLLTLDSNIYSGWELLGDVGLLARLAPSQFSQLNVSTIHSILVNKAESLGMAPLVEAIRGIDLRDGCTALLHIASSSYQIILYGLSSNALVGHFLYKAAFALHALHIHVDSESHHNQGLAYICSALNCDPTNPLFWELLAIMTISTKPSISQHAFCQSLKLDPRNPSPYANYGYLCLLQSDFELAAASFTKAQSISPELAPSWIGQAAVAQMTAAPNTSEIIAHAFSLNESISRGLNLVYASCLMKDSLPSTLTRQQLNSGIFALQKYIELAPAHAQALNLLAAYYEQAGSLEAAADALTKAKDSLVAMHMANQDPALLPPVFAQFVRVMLNLGRVLTARKQFNEAGAAYQAAEGCVAQLGGSISERDAVHLQLGLGIAKFYHNDLQPALESFERALALSTGYPGLHHQVTLQVSQALWAMGGNNHQEAAKEQLMGCVRNQTHTVGVLLALLVMGLIQGDNDLSSAVIGELGGVQPHKQSQEDPDMLMPHALSLLEVLQNNSPGAVAMLTSSLLKHPYLAEPYLTLVQLLLQVQDASSVKMVRQIAMSGLAIAITDPNNSLPGHSTSPAVLVSHLYLAQASASQLATKRGDPSLDVQRAVFAAPWLYSLP